MITRSKIETARNINLAEFLMANGEELTPDGIKRYRHSEHSSLIFTDNVFFWNSQNKSGNSIDFLMLYYEMTFKNAVNELLNPKYNLKKSKNFKEEPKKSKFDFNSIELSNDLSRARAYLSKTRKIEINFVDELIENGLLFQEKGTNNIIFPVYNEKNDIVGAEAIGTNSFLRYKSVKKDSDGRYGFWIGYAFNGKFTKILFFESVIDLLSYRQLNDISGCLLVSMAGLKESVVFNMCRAFQDNVSLECVLCVDNDEAGKQFSDSLQKKIKIAIHLPEQRFKDWNEQLQFK